MVLHQSGAYTDQFGIGPACFFTMLNVQRPLQIGSMSKTSSGDESKYVCVPNTKRASGARPVTEHFGIVTSVMHVYTLKRYGCEDAFHLRFAVLSLKLPR